MADPRRSDYSFDSSSVPVEKAEGLLFIADPHVAAVPPGHRLDGYKDQVLEKVRLALEHARDENLLPVFLGDLFHWPRENPNSLIVQLIGLFKKYKPWVLVGNHDKYQARLTPDCSISVLAAADAIRLIDEAGPAFRLETPTGQALICASPDGFPLPKSFDDAAVRDGEVVLWLTHHNINFPDFEERQVKTREISGVNMVINGHIHRPQESVRTGKTLWCNPGNISRLTFSIRSKERKPAAAIWKPGMDELEKWYIPYLPFEDVFPDREFADHETGPEKDSGFVQGLERLAERRTREGVGLKEFLDVNLDEETPEGKLVWELYKEVVHGNGT